MRCGIDLGGTKIEAVILDDDGQIIWKKRTETPKSTYQDILNVVVQIANESAIETQFAGPIGIGTPGSTSPKTGLIQGANTTVLNGQNLADDCQKLIGRPIRTANDANCFALSEAQDGAAKDHNTVFGVIIGTGCGGSFIVNKTIIEGRHGIAGEWGHTPLPSPLEGEYDGHDCWCGNSGCLETFIAGPAISAEYAALTNTMLTAKEIAQRSHLDPFAENAMQAFEDRLARGLAQIINIFDPDAIVLGGGLSNLERIYTNVPRKWPGLIFSDIVNTPLLKPKYGDSSGVRGAAWLWPPNK